MPSSFQLDCPHCQTKRAGFVPSYQHWFRDPTNRYVLTAICGVCDYPILVHYQDLQLGKTTTSPVNLTDRNTDFPGNRFYIMEVWPETATSAPDSLPDNVANFFEQGLRNERAESWDAAGAMFRKSLDVATKILDPSGSSLTLFKRIEQLKESGRLTADLAEWAHEVRIEGNSSVHDDDPETREDVIAIHEFARAFLLFTFTIPELVKARSTAEIEA
jgi:hypothetical protein